MSAPTINAATARDLHETLARLRIARIHGNEAEEITAELRLNYLLDRLPRKDTACSSSA